MFDFRRVSFLQVKKQTSDGSIHLFDAGTILKVYFWCLSRHDPLTKSCSHKSSVVLVMIVSLNHMNDMLLLFETPKLIQMYPNVVIESTWLLVWPIKKL